jgi:hypothetical protein
MNETEEKSSAVKIIKWIALCLFIGLLVAVAIPNFIRPHVTYAENACVNNMRQIEAAKQKWAMENGKTNGSIVTENEIIPYLKGWSRTNFPECPSGGLMQLREVCGDRRCSPKSFQIKPATAERARPRAQQRPQTTLAWKLRAAFCPARDAAAGDGRAPQIEDTPGRVLLPSTA